MSGLIFLGIIVIIIVALVYMYNGLVQAKNGVKNAWSQIDVQLKRRHDLIPNLVETVKGYMNHERETLESVTKARQQAVDLQNASIGDRANIENILTKTLKSLFAVSENYPDLEANQNFLQLQEEIVNTENKLAYSKQAYNDSIERYNAMKKSFFESFVVTVFSSKLEKTFVYWNLPEETIKEREDYTVKL